MPWKETDTVQQRRKFIEEVRRRELSMSQLCETFEVSRKTAYKWLARFNEEGVKGLADRSRAPEKCPHALAPEVQEACLAVRNKHKTWGPRKVIAWLKTNRPALEPPAPSTVGELFKREGLVQARRRRTRLPSRTQPFAEIRAPNDTWCADYKGQFRVGSGVLCYPLTITDACSRFLLKCTARRSTDTAGAKQVYEAAFREYGLPRVIRTDNGPPFGSLAPLSMLAIWLVKLGIRPEFIKPGNPQQNGRHERFHWTLKQECALPPCSTFEKQQDAFDEFAQVYNFERPHEALNNETPGSVYVPSPRPFPSMLQEMTYPTHFDVRRVKPSGEISWGAKRVFISEALRREIIGLDEQPDGSWHVYFGPMRLGVLTNEPRFVRREKAVWTDQSGPLVQRSPGATPPPPAEPDLSREGAVSPMSPV